MDDRLWHGFVLQPMLYGSKDALARRVRRELDRPAAVVDRDHTRVEPMQLLRQEVSE